MQTRRKAPFHLESFLRCAGSARLVGLYFQALVFGMLAFGLLGLAGCTSIQVALGLRMRLNDVPVSAVTVSLFKGPGLAPGKSSRLVAVATTADGKQLVSEGAGRGKVLWDSFDLEATVAQISKKGVVALPADPRKSEGLVPHLTITVKGHPGIAAEIDIPVRYDVRFVANFSGAAGSDGSAGSDGNSGSDGSDGSTDPKNPKPGGAGSDGGAGANGGDGQAGEPGQNLHVWVTLKDGAHPLLAVKVVGASDERLFLVDPHGGSLLVKADGGPGGSAGAGGRGGRGGRGRCRNAQRDRRCEWIRRLQWLARQRRGSRYYYCYRRPSSEAFHGHAAIFEQERVWRSWTHSRNQGARSATAVVSEVTWRQDSRCLARRSRSRRSQEPGARRQSSERIQNSGPFTLTP